MKNYYLFVLFFVFSGFGAHAQLKMLTVAHDFGLVDELQPDSFSLVFQNNYTFDVEITKVTGFEIYGQQPFSTSHSNFFVPANGTSNIWVYFHPDQNIEYDQQLIFHTTSRGSFALNVSGQGIYSKTYYLTTRNKSEEVLKTKLNTLLGQGYVTLSYNAARDKMYGSIDNVNGDVECVYTGRTATFNTRAGANSNNFNCEHTWPQSLFSSASPMKSDIHHLFPTDVTANSQRGSLPFGVVSGSGSWSQGGSKKNSSYFEPRNVHKGAVARAMMYFVLRYQNYSNFFTGQEAVLRQWHDQYPPSAWDKQRNTAIFNEQNNRNPFVDYPQIIQRINSLSGTSAAPAVDSIYVSTDTVYFKNLVSGDSLVYSYVITNAGNSSVQITGMTNTNNVDYTVLNVPNAFTLEPGESYTYKFYMNQIFSSVHLFNLNTSVGTIPGYVATGPDISLDEWIKTRIQVYPNPTIDHVQLFAPINELLSYQLVDALGNVLQNGTFRGSVTIDTRSLRWGNYYLNIYRNTLIHVEPILKVSR